MIIRIKLISLNRHQGVYADSEKKMYYRMMQSIDTSNNEQTAKVISMFGDAVLKGLAVKVVLDPPPAPDTHSNALVEHLRELPQCHFA